MSGIEASRSRRHGPFDLISTGYSLELISPEGVVSVIGVGPELGFCPWSAGNPKNFPAVFPQIPIRASPVFVGVVETIVEMYKDPITFAQVDFELAAADLPRFEPHRHVDRVERACLDPMIGAP